MGRECLEQMIVKLYDNHLLEHYDHKNRELCSDLQAIAHQTYQRGVNGKLRNECGVAPSVHKV